VRCGEAEGGTAGEGEVGVGGEEEGRFWKFFEKQGFFGSIRAAEGKEGVWPRQVSTELRGRFLVKKTDGGAMEEWGAGEVDLFPETAQRGRRVQSRSGELGSHELQDSRLKSGREVFSLFVLSDKGKLGKAKSEIRKAEKMRGLGV
jgi:hypothetical protein